VDLATFQPSKSLSHWASADPHATALVGPNASFSATELFETVQGLAAGLIASGAALVVATRRRFSRSK